MEDAKLQALHDSLSQIRGRKGLGTGGSQFSWQTTTAAATSNNNLLPNNMLYAHFVPEGSYDPNNKASFGDGRTIKRDFSDCVDSDGDDAVEESSASREKRKRRRKEEKKAAKLEVKRQAKLEEKRRLKRQTTTAQEEVSTKISSTPDVAPEKSTGDAKDSKATVSDDSAQYEESNDNSKEKKKDKKSKNQKEEKKRKADDKKELVESVKPDTKTAVKRQRETETTVAAKVTISETTAPIENSKKEKKAKKKSKRA
jgi:hypothetical protein